jgi:2-alkenal reductase
LREPGVVVVEVLPGSAAARAGLRGFPSRDRGINLHGDEIVQVDGRPVRSAGDLLRAVSTRHAGDVLRLSVARIGRRGMARPVLSVPVKLPPLQ